MKITQLEEILEVARVGSISKAAQNLYMGQPNLSQSIRKVEDELGISIFTRTSTGVGLTREGHDFIKRAEEIILQLNALKYSYSEHSIHKRLELCIASPDFRILDIELGKILQKYEANTVFFNVIDATGVRLLRLVEENRADIGFFTVYQFTKKLLLRQIEMKGLDFNSLGPVRTGIMVGKNNPRFTAKNKYVDFEMLKDMTFVSLADREFNAQTIDSFLINERGIDFRYRNNILVSNFGVCRSILTTSNAFIIVGYLETNYGDMGFYDDVRFIPFENGLLSAEMGYVTKKNTMLPQLGQDLLSAIKYDFMY